MENNNLELETIILQDDTGKDVEFSIIEETTFQGNNYILISNEDEECLVMKEIAKDESDFVEYAFIEDEDEEEAILNIFSIMFESDEE